MGPTLLAASGPIEWHGAHFRNDCSPAATSWASTVPVDRTRPTAANARCLIWFLLDWLRAPATAPAGAPDCERASTGRSNGAVEAACQGPAQRPRSRSGVGQPTLDDG